MAMLRSTRQGESVSVVVARQEDLFLPRELVRECGWTCLPCPSNCAIARSFLLIWQITSPVKVSFFLFFIVIVFCCFFYVYFVFFFPFYPSKGETSFVPVPFFFLTDNRHTSTCPGHTPSFRSHFGLLTQQCFRKSHTQAKGNTGVCPQEC